MRTIGRLLVTVIPTLLLAAAMMQTSVDPKLLMLDPMVAAEVSGECCRTYYGIFSTLGVMGWIATTSLCAFAAYLLFVLRAPAQMWGFALFAALFTGFLAFDDAFLFHENIAPKLGIPQTGVLGLYVVLAGLYCLFAWRIILRADFALFITAGFFLAVSMGLDVVLHSTNSLIVSAEDGAKFIGIFCWLGFHASAMIMLLKEHTSGAQIQPSSSRMAFATRSFEQKAVAS